MVNFNTSLTIIKAIKHRSENHINLSPSLNIITSQQHIKDLGVTMPCDCSFYEHKFVTVETKDELSMQNFVDELKQLNICDQFALREIE